MAIKIKSQLFTLLLSQCTLRSVECASERETDRDRERERARYWQHLIESLHFDALTGLLCAFVEKFTIWIAAGPMTYTQAHIHIHTCTHIPRHTCPQKLTRIWIIHGFCFVTLIALRRCMCMCVCCSGSLYTCVWVFGHRPQVATLLELFAIYWQQRQTDNNKLGDTPDTTRIRHVVRLN